MLLANSYNLSNMVCEAPFSYHLDSSDNVSNKPPINNEHDKIFRKILDNKNYIRDMQETLKGYNETPFNKYNIVDVNNFSEDDLLKENSLLSKALLLEKTRYSNDLVMYLEKIVAEVNSSKKVYSKEQKQILKTIINLVLRRKLENTKTEELIKKLEGGDDNMLAVLEMIDEENRRLIETGEKRGKKHGIIIGEKRGQKQGKKIEKIETVKKMLIRGFSIETISDITELNEKEIQKYADRLLKNRKL